MLVMLLDFQWFPHIEDLASLWNGKHWFPYIIANTVALFPGYHPLLGGGINTESGGKLGISLGQSSCSVNKLFLGQSVIN